MDSSLLMKAKTWELQEPNQLETGCRFLVSVQAKGKVSVK